MSKDSHLTYIDARTASGVLAAYDVYGPCLGPQLGRVERRRYTWVAMSDDASALGRTRWEAATALWGKS